MEAQRDSSQTDHRRYKELLLSLTLPGLLLHKDEIVYEHSKKPETEHIVKAAGKKNGHFIICFIKKTECFYLIFPAHLDPNFRTDNIVALLLVILRVY